MGFLPLPLLISLSAFPLFSSMRLHYCTCICAFSVSIQPAAHSQLSDNFRMLIQPTDEPFIHFIHSMRFSVTNSSYQPFLTHLKSLANLMKELIRRFNLTLPLPLLYLIFSSLIPYSSSSLPSSYPIPFHLPEKENWKYGMRRRMEDEG